MFSIATYRIQGERVTYDGMRFRYVIENAYICNCYLMLPCYCGSMLI